MKQIGIFKKLVVGSVAILTLACTLDVQAEAKQAAGKVRKVVGTAQVSVAGGGWTALKAGAEIKPGSAIRTGAESTVDVFLNNSVIRVTPDTTVSVDKLQIDNSGAENIYSTGLSVKSGRLLGNVKKLAHASKYEIKTPNGVAGIRGTDFDIKVTPLGNGKYRLTITSVEGTIVGSAVNMAGNVVTAVINTGEAWDPDAEGVKLLPEEIHQALIALFRELQDGGTPDPLIINTPQDKFIIRVDPVTSGVDPVEEEGDFER